jgi:hypothetical protein
MRPRLTPSRLVIAALLVLGAAGAWQPQAGSTHPYRLALDVSYGEPTGSESFREDLERSLLHELARCFDAVQSLDAEDGGSERDLTLRIVIDDFEEETSFDVSMAQLNSPDAEPDTKRQLVVQFRANFQFELLTVPDSGVVRSKRNFQHAAHRPVLNEDPRYEARLKLIEGVVRFARGFACKGSAKKLEREVERARASTASRAAAR